MQATEAGNDTEKCLKKVSTPKQATRMTRIPIGTYIQERNSFWRECQNAYRVLLASGLIVDCVGRNPGGGCGRA